VSETAKLSRIVDPAPIRPEGLALTVTASKAERESIAAFLGLLELRSLTADLTLSRSKSGRIGIGGTLHADLVQSCVVTLAPVVQTVDEEVDRSFVPDWSDQPPSDGGQVDIAVDEEEPPDTYSKSGIDVGSIVLEQLILGIDPYPRAPGAELPKSAEEPSEETESAFAILKSIGHSSRT
jgi:uncharacterized metal-binding protein YceD (DUF177 family)